MISDKEYQKKLMRELFCEFALESMRICTSFEIEDKSYALENYTEDTVKRALEIANASAESGEELPF